MDTLVVQFNYGFFDLHKLASFLDAQVTAGRTVVVEMHATTDPAQVGHKRLADLVPALARCSRVLAHSLADMNRLKHLGLVHNVSLFPLGILDHPTQTPPIRTDGQCVVASYGFFLPHKGLLELMEAVLLLRAQGVAVLLKMVNAEYPAPQSAHLIQQARDKIDAAHAHEAIELITQYLEDSDSLSQLGQADLIVFPYQETGESASAAVRHGIASGRPVAVTPLGIFDDVQDAVHQLPGTTPEQMAQGLRLLIDKLALADEDISGKAQAASRWCMAHRHSSLAHRMTNMLTGLHGQYRVRG
jgi:glycosyltransferase involved in cell wall biosynthesis